MILSVCLFIQGNRSEPILMRLSQAIKIKSNIMNNTQIQKQQKQRSSAIRFLKKKEEFLPVSITKPKNRTAKRYYAIETAGEN